jgi:Ribonuclease toxin, BrnT, of type II toxin-antitoxin system
MEFGSKRPRAFSAIHMNAYFMIRGIPSARIDSFLLGVSSAARTLVVVHCYRENDSVVRIISARKATRKEVRFYEEGI